MGIWFTSSNNDIEGATMDKLISLLNLIKEYCIDAIKRISLVQMIGTSAALCGVTFVIDYYNLPSKVIVPIPSLVAKVVAVCAVIFLISYIANSKMTDITKVKSVTLYDSYIFICIITICMILIVYEVAFEALGYRKTVIIIIAMVLLAQKTFDLNEVIKPTFRRVDNDPILITEKDVDYDLLGRESIINHIYQSIVSAASGASFVVGVVGEWGSGKTTIINNVKRILHKNNKIIIIDDFDPWVYGSEASMLRGMYDAILNKTGMRFDSIQKRKMLRDLNKALVPHKQLESVVGVVFNNLNDFGDFESSKKQLKNYLERGDKTIVFVIDNIDRASAENVLFLFKLIGAIFDLPKILYVLAYDKKRINEIFNDTLKINPKYVEKIVQQEIEVPEIQPEMLLKIYAACMENVLKSYGVKTDEIKEYQTLFNLITKKVKNLRTFKRMINSAFSMSFTAESILSRKELLAIEVIRFLAPALYGEIYNNRKYFISCDKTTDMELWKTTISSEHFNRSGKQFFDELFEEYGEYKELLSELFPYVKRYSNNTSLEIEGWFSREEYEEISNRSGICSGKYFDLYFSYGSNDFAIISDVSKRFLNHVNSISSYEDAEALIKKILYELPFNQHREFIEKLQNVLPKVSAHSMLYLSNAIFSNLSMMDDGASFFTLSAKRRAIYVVAKLLSKCNAEEVESFVRLYEKDYSKLDDISQLKYWAGSVIKENGALNNKLDAIIEEMHKKMAVEVVTKKINLYDDKYYKQKNIWGLIRGYKDDDAEPPIIKEYIQTIVSEKNVYRVLWDLT